MFSYVDSVLFLLKELGVCSLCVVLQADPQEGVSWSPVAETPLVCSSDPSNDTEDHRSSDADETRLSQRRRLLCVLWVDGSRRFYSHPAAYIQVRFNK